jgi:hypothetical protein
MFEIGRAMKLEDRNPPVLCLRRGALQVLQRPERTRITRRGE